MSRENVELVERLYEAFARWPFIDNPAMQASLWAEG
jgi:hypothetical protein